MAKLSSQSLFHYVSKKEYLIDILQNDFHPRYVKEEFSFETRKLKEVAIPMLCFCDITLSNIEEHVKWYGNYGIGMKKEWAIKNGLTPVHYFNPKSHAMKDLAVALNYMREDFENNRIQHSGYIRNYYNIWFMKPYEGKQFNHQNDKNCKKKFYDEREWRYIPSLDELKNLAGDLSMSLTGDRLNRFINEPEYKKNINKKLADSVRLSFRPEDITYIIVENEQERAEIIQQIKNVKSKHGNKVVDIVCSKIISLEQIKNDF